MRNPKPLLDRATSDHIGDFDCIVHGGDFAKYFRRGQAKRFSSRASEISQTLRTVDKPFEDIAEKLKWHRETVLGVTQDEYASRIGVKRSRYSRWEAGNDRLSLDGALILRRKYGLSLDFMYDDIDDALPMTLRNAWRERP